MLTNKIFNASALLLYDYRVLPLGSADLLTRLSRAAEPSGNLLETDSLNLIFRLLEPDIPTS